MMLRTGPDWSEVWPAPMKPLPILLVAAALAVTACSPKRLSPVVLREPAPVKSSPARPGAGPAPMASASVRTPGRSRTSGTAPAAAHAHKPSKAPGRVSATSARTKADEAARAAEKKRKLASARRVQAKKLAEASYEAGRQLLRENQTEPALRAFRESVRLNSHSPDAWMGVAYVCEITGNTKDAVEAFRAAKKLWGM